MKRLFIILLTGVLCQLSALAQTINYQGVARNTQGAPLSNTPIAVRLSVKSAASGGNTFYSETKTATTNGFGLYTISINDGSGNQTGNFNSINWSQPTYIQTEIDPANGTAFIDMGTAPVQSVPSSIVAKNLEGVLNPQDGDMLVFKNNQWQKKPAVQIYEVGGIGADPTTALSMLSSPVTITIIHPNPVLSIHVTKAFGSFATGWATGLMLNVGYKRIDIPDQPITQFSLGRASGGLRVSSGTRVLFTLSEKIRTSLEPGTYLVGMVGLASSQQAAATWNDNGPSRSTVEVEY